MGVQIGGGGGNDMKQLELFEQVVCESCGLMGYWKGPICHDCYKQSQAQAHVTTCYLCGHVNELWATGCEHCYKSFVD